MASSSRAVHAASLTLALASLGAGVAQGAQLKVIDTTYVHTENNRALNPQHDVGKGLQGSHAALEFTAEQPANWTSPVDYRKGRIHLVLDVLEKPSDISVKLATCFIQSSYTCSNGLPFTKTGHFEASQPVSSWYQYAQVDWTRRFGFVTSIVRGPNGNKIDIGENFDHEPDFSAYVPMKVRMRVFAVSEGATFVLPAESPPDAGMPPHPLDAGLPELDAGLPPLLDAGTSATPDAGEQAATPAEPPAPLSSRPDVVVGGCQAAPFPLLLGGGLLALLGLRRRAGREN